jgi:hypothetical protein
MRPYFRAETGNPLLRAIAMVLAIGATWGCAGVESSRGILDDAGASPGPDADAPPGDGRDAAAEAVGLCANGADDDRDLRADCRDENCAASPFCCLGSSAEHCCEERGSQAVDFSMCSSSEPLMCDGIWRVFGSPAPGIVDGALVPNGTDHFDSGVVLTDEVDPRLARLTLLATIRAGEECTACRDGVAIGLTSGRQNFGATTRVSADVALVVSAIQSEVRLLVGDVVVGSLSFDRLREVTGGMITDADVVYELQIKPEGLVSAYARAAGVDGGSGQVEIATDIPYVPAGPARVVIWGRTSNRGNRDPRPTRIRELEVVSHLCDVPASVARESASILPDDVDTWWPDSHRIHGSSTLVDTDRVTGAQHGLMVFSYEGGIFAARGLPDPDRAGYFRALRDPQVATNALIGRAEADWIAGGVSDPELVRGTDRWRIYFTAISRDGLRSIGRADGEPGFMLQFRSMNIVQMSDLSPQPDPDPDNGVDERVLGYDHPDVATVTVQGQQKTFLAVRKITPGGTSIVLYRLDGDHLDPTPVLVPDESGSALVTSDAVVRSRDGRGIAFDVDEVAAPALVAYRGLLRLYYAGRRGTRWAIGLMVSEDGIHWWPANGGAPILTGSGAAMAFDALSVSDPDPVVVDPNPDVHGDEELRLYYTGSDGVNMAIGLARLRIPVALPPAPSP